MELLSEGMAGMVHAKEVEIARHLLDVELPEDPIQAVPMWFGIVQDQITKQLRAKGEPVPDLNAVAVSDPINAVEFLFPHYFLLPFFSSMSSYRIRPLGPESCLFEIWSLTHAAPKARSRSRRWSRRCCRTTARSSRRSRSRTIRTSRSSRRACTRQGSNSCACRRTSKGLISNYQRIIDGYLVGVAPDKLAKATQLLGGNFDGKILDLGL